MLGGLRIRHAQLVALGKTLLVIPASSRAWQWPEHVAVPVVDAPDVTTVIAWPPGTRSPAVASLVRSATRLHGHPALNDVSAVTSGRG